MSIRLTDSVIKGLPAPAGGNRVYYDDTVKGFGCRITAAGARAFVLNYRTTSGRERRYTIGAFPDWRTTAAREAAKRLKLEIRANGADPVGGLQAARGEPTVADLCARYLEEHAVKKRPRSAQEDRDMIRTRVLPALGTLKVRDITFSNIDALHRKVTQLGTPIRANRVLGLLSKAFSLSIKWRWRTDNPCKGVERNPETKRHRYLSGAELAALTGALAEHPDQQAADIVRLLLLTGARRGEVLSAKWEDLDLEAGVWSKPASATKQKRLHVVPLSAPARQLLSTLRSSAGEGVYVFPGRGGGHRESVHRAWQQLCKSARISGARLHDLRHTYASLLVSSGLSLPVIGALLGHTQPSTTARYSHLMDDPLRAATETVGAIIAGKPSAEVVSIKGGGR